MNDSAYRQLLLGLPDAGNSSSKKDILLYLKADIQYHKNLLTESLQGFCGLLSESSLNNKLKIYSYANIGAIYLVQGNYKKSLLYHLALLNHYTLHEPTTLQKVYNNVGLSYLNTGDVIHAKQYFQKSILISKQLKDTVGLANTYINIANQYYNAYQDRLAITYFKKGLSLALLTQEAEIKALAYINMSVVDENNKNYRSALNYRKNYETQHDSIYNRDKVWSLAQVQNRLDSEESAHKIEIAWKTNQLQSLQLKEQKQQFYIAFFASATFLPLFIFALYAYRQKNKQNAVIIAQREELNALNRTKDQLFSVVAHDLRSPVQTMKITLTKLKAALYDKNINQAEQISGDIERISNSTHSLLNNLLYWALSQTGQLRFQKERLNISRFVDGVLYDYRSIAAAKNITLENRVWESLYCNGDLNTVTIMLRNLIDNAIKFSEPDTAIVISATDYQKECVISVADGGKGIEETIVKALHDKRTKRVDSQQGGEHSTGIGLWLVKTMAEHNGGSLHIERQQRGTRVNIHLPSLKMQ